MTKADALELAKVPPQAPELEQAVLGALMLERQAWTDIGDLLTPAMFYVEAHGIIFNAIREIFTKGNAADILTVTVLLKDRGELDIVGGAFYISQLTGKVASSANIEYHARILVQKFLARELTKIGPAIAKDGYESDDVFDALDRASAALTDLYSHTSASVVESAAAHISAVMDKRRSKHYTFGIDALDQMAVFEAGLPAVFAGRPGIGKSIFCVEVCWHLTLAGNVLMFSPEMTPQQVTARIIARESGVPYSAILHGRMDEQQVDNATATAMRIADRMERLKIDPQSGITPDQIRMRTERAIKKDGVIAFAVDHLHKMRTGDPRTDRDDFQRITQCMNRVTEVAKNTMLPALVMCQLNREVEKRAVKKPTMADLRGSGAIEEDAAIVGLLYRSGYYLPEPPHQDELEIYLGKNRDGSVGEAKCSIIPAYSRIGPLSQSQITNNIQHVKASAPF